MSEIKILLIGASGQIGRHLKCSLRPFGRVVAPVRSACDLSDGESVARCCELVRPRLIVNAAGYTDVVGAETKEGLCRKVNVIGTGFLVDMSRKYNAPLVQYSSDYVFDGSKLARYTEEDITNPLNVYGKSKRDSELLITQADIPHMIFRVQWVYDSIGVNFLTKMLSLMRMNEEVRVVGDQFGIPNSAYCLARYTAEVLNSRQRLSVVFNRSGTYNLVNSGYTTWYGFALEIAKRIPVAKKKCMVLNYLSSQQFRGVKRPSYSVLSNEKAKKIFKVNFLDWKEVFMRDIVLR